ncbi:MAG: HNH endonuclease [Thermoplasmata archaeon]|nr:HNH endonuclease [Thermoplasmata archaeon]MBE3136783.1 HNH endonuclease [Thermoplasmata archaeon]MBE3139559.1 HNH endonuclease [Thermoplasmata archaeon]
MIQQGHEDMEEIDIEIFEGLSRISLEKLYGEKCHIDPKTGYYKFNNSDMYVHRWIMEKILKRKLAPEEVVHHINGNKLDNHPSNLMLFEDEEDYTD